jgi:hypothetical protein
MQTAKTKEILATDKMDGIQVVSRVTRGTVKTKNLGNGKRISAARQGHRGRKENGIAIKTDKGNRNKDL